MRTVSQEQLADLMSPVIWHGRYFTTLCPYHDDTHPSFNVYPDGAVCLAASCGRHVSLSQLARKVSPLTAVQPQFSSERRQSLIAWESIPDREQLCYEAHDYLVRRPEQGHYLKQRGLAVCIRPQQLGYWNGWITIPIFNLNHSFLGLVLRATPSMQAATQVRYLTPPGQKRLLYIPDHSLTLYHAKFAFIVFGMFDALALSLLGYPVVTCTNIHDFQAHDLNALRYRLIVIPDKGEAAKGQALVSGLDWRGQLLELPYGDNLKDCADYVEQGYSKRLNQLLQPNVL